MLAAGYTSGYSIHIYPYIHILLWALASNLAPVSIAGYPALWLSPAFDPRADQAWDALAAGAISASSYFYDAAMKAADAAHGKEPGAPQDISDVKGGTNNPGWRKTTGKEPNVEQHQR